MSPTGARTFVLGLAIVVLLGAALLIFNTIQLAIFARRREVAVMKLVGATNWFIRVPFMLEGLIEGIIGAIAASLIIYFARNQVLGLLDTSSWAAPRRCGSPPARPWAPACC